MAFYHHVRHFVRYRKIARVFFKYGVGSVINVLGLDRFLSKHNLQDLKENRPESAQIRANHFCQALTELGSTFIKLGQIFSTRPDIFSPAYIEELEKLQDKVEPFSYAEVVELLIKELGHPDEIFAEFDPEPLAAASIGQVHMARLQTGERVIVKVQRPKIERIVENDLEILLELAELSEKRSEAARRLGLKRMLEDFSRLLLRELDYDREARNTERMYKYFATNDSVLIPMVYWEYTTRRVLTEDYIEGVKLTDLEEIKSRGWDCAKMSRLGSTAFLSQIILYGFFQADPHPGNILITDEDHIAFIDFGQVSALSPKRLNNLCDLLISVNDKDVDKAVVTLKEMGVITGSVEMDSFQEDLSNLIEHISVSRIGNLDMNMVRKDFLDLSYRYQLRVPSYLTSLMKALITVEGVGRKLDPSFNFMEIATPMTQEVMRERLKPEKIAGFLRHKYYSDLHPLTKLPGTLERLLDNMDQGKLNMSLQIGFSETARRSITKLVNRLSASLIIAASLVSTSLIIRSSHPEMFVSHASIGMVGFIVSLVALIIFAVSFIRD